MEEGKFIDFLNQNVSSTKFETDNPNIQFRKGNLGHITRMANAF